MSRFVWYDLMTPDADASQAFYTSTLGWGTRVNRPVMGVDGNPPYTLLTAGNAPVGGIVPFGEPGDSPYWIGFVRVASVHDSIARAIELGAETIYGPAEIPDEGRFAVLSDPQGATFGVYQAPSGSQASEPFAPQPGQFSWHELATSDWRAALDFYQAMFGWETINQHDMGPLGFYLVFGEDGTPYGGMYSKSLEAPDPAWCYYVRVEDADAAVQDVTKSGGRVINGPVEVPGGNRVAQCVDPSGGMFAVHQLAG